MSPEQQTTTELAMDPDALYREDVFTDRRVGTLRRLTPVNSNGSEDPSRPTVYVGQAQLMTPVGAVPLNFEIEADSLQQALERYPEAGRQAVDKTMEELKEMRREAASSIVLPEQGGGGAGGGAGGPGGGIQFP